MKRNPMAAMLLVACTLPAAALTPGDKPAQTYCPLLSQAGFGPLAWNERIGGCVGRKSWPDERGFEVAHYVYRVGGTKSVLESVTLISEPGKTKAKSGREALAVAAAEAAALLS